MLARMRRFLRQFAKTRSGRVIGVGVLAAMMCFSIFYLFVVPAVVAGGHEPLPIVGLAFGGFMYVQLWMLSLEFAYQGLARIYGFRHTRLFFRSILGSKDRSGSEVARSPFEAIFATMLSYSVAVYGFALLFVAISNRDHASFTGGAMSVATAFYFSLVTATTVGFGDIAPVSTAARFTVVVEIGVALLYAIFLFSVLAGAARDARTTQPRVFRSRLRRHARGVQVAIATANSNVFGRRKKAAASELRLARRVSNGAAERQAHIPTSRAAKGSA